MDHSGPTALRRHSVLARDAYKQRLSAEEIAYIESRCADVTSQLYA